ncbi:prephenate dehydrogenase [Filibacter tadaridae]|uniref:Prephenate dehydrogenase n=1 Tax=Filibacter tadaridae TaxID=2483811 RepID=A0A3P5XKQ3_9BACL|nr:prephenate dehydrogenase [Filibacter tadaridae]VDC29212.1 prephenate dehydrogenase [Filibacter tadaridae]
MNIAIIGLGLIGGSVGLALKRDAANRITGFDHSSTTAEEAYRRGIIDSVALSLEDACYNTDVIIFATPVNTTVDMLEEIRSMKLKDGVIITDTGSTKVPIMDAASILIDQGLTFIGGHPMAGSHKSGVSAAKEHLFENAYYILTPDPRTDQKHVEQLRQLLRPTKGKVRIVEATEHDRMTAVVSHFPHLVASSLVGRLADQQEHQPFIKKLAAGGFRDLTRIASADPVMWRDITIQNRDELLKQLDGWFEEMSAVREMITANDPVRIYNYFAEAKKFRDELPLTSQGALYMTYDLHVDIPDHPGIISEITKILADERISITNIRIVETRTDVYGILVISFQSADDREHAKFALTSTTNFSMHIV